MKGRRMLSSKGRLFSIALLTAAGSFLRPDALDACPATNNETVNMNARAVTMRFIMFLHFIAFKRLFFRACFFEQTDNFSSSLSSGQFQSRLVVFGFYIDPGATS